jgi:hypothetical protein
LSFCLFLTGRFFSCAIFLTGRFLFVPAIFLPAVFCCSSRLLARCPAARKPSASWWSSPCENPRTSRPYTPKQTLVQNIQSVRIFEHTISSQ